MARSDSTEVKVAAAVALTAALFSPQVRGVLRRGAVHGLAGALTIGDAIASFARGVSRGIQEASASPADAAAPDPVATAAVATTEDGAPGSVAAVRPRRRRPARPRSTPASPSDAAASTTAPVSAPADGARE